MQPVPNTCLPPLIREHVPETSWSQTDWLQPEAEASTSYHETKCDSFSPTPSKGIFLKSNHQITESFSGYLRLQAIITILTLNIHPCFHPQAVIANHLHLKIKYSFFFMNNAFPGLESPAKCFFTKLSQSQAKILSFIENVIICNCSLGPCSSRRSQTSSQNETFLELSF